MLHVCNGIWNHWQFMGEIWGVYCYMRKLILYNNIAIISQSNGSHFNIWYDVLSSDLMKPGSHNIGSLIYDITLKFGRHLSSTTAEVPVKFQSDCTIPNTNLMASRLCKILQWDVLSHTEMGAAEAPVTFQSDCTILNTNLIASRLCKILQ